MAGAGYKLFTTGQVLTAAEVNTYLQEQTVMVFNDAASRTTALSGVLAEGMVSYLKSTKVVEIYNGTAWASLDDPNAIQNTIVDAKGDLITATGNDVPARLAVGNNGETLVADSSQTTGLRWTTPVASLANPIINGGFDVWQRGTSFSGAGTVNTFTADRWTSGRNGNALTVSRQTTNDTTNLPNIQYCARVQRDSGNTSTQTAYLVQNFETASTLPLAGKTITYSFYARAGANYSPSSSQLQAYAVYGTGTDQNGWLSYTNATTLIAQNVTISTTWQRFAVTVTLPATATEMYIGWGYSPTGTAGANDYYEVTGAQIDVGTWTASTAPTFRRSGGTLAGELAACQRYLPAIQTGTGDFASGQCYSTTRALIVLPFQVPARVAPTGVTVSSAGHFSLRTSTAGLNGVSALTFTNGTQTAACLDATTTGLTAGNGTSLYNAGSGTLLFTGCEL